MASHLYQQQKDIFSKKIDGSWMILSANKKFAHQLNSTASFIWTLLKQPTSIDQITQKMRQQFQIDLETAKKDVKKTIKQLLRLKFIQSVD